MNHQNAPLPTEPDELVHIPQVHCAYGECPCSNVRNCSIWIEYQIATVSLHDSEGLSNGNWCEITRLRDYIGCLRLLLDNHGITYGNEFHMPDCPTDEF